MERSPSRAEAVKYESFDHPHFLELVLASASDAICCLDTEGRVTYINATAVNLLRLSPEELLGKSLHDAIYATRPDGRPYPPAECPIMQTAGGGGASKGEEYFYRKDGSGFPAAYTTYSIIDGDKVLGSVVALQDLHSKREAEQERSLLLHREQKALDEARLAHARLELLVQTAEVLGSTLDYKSTLGNVVQLALPHLGSRATVNLLDDDNQTLCRVAVAEVTGNGEVHVSRPDDQFPLSKVEGTPTGTVLRTRRAIRMNGLQADTLEAIIPDPVHRERFRLIGLSGLLVVPILASDKLLGVFTFGQEGDYTEQDERLAYDIARLASMAIHNALLYRQASSFKQVLDQSPDAIWVLDRAGRFTYVNQRATTLYSHYSHGSLLGKSVLDVVPPEQLEESKANLVDLLAGKPFPPVVTTQVMATGEEQSLSYSAVPIMVDGQVLGGAAFVRDVTNLAKVQERLRDSLVQMQLVDDVGQSMLAGRTRQELMDRLVETLAGRYGYEAAFCFHPSVSGSALELRSKAGVRVDDVELGLRIRIPGWWNAERNVRARHARRDGDRKAIILHELPSPFRAEVTVPILHQGRCVALVGAVTRTGFTEAQSATLEAVAKNLTRMWERMHLLEELHTKSEEMEAYLFATTHDLRSPLVNVLGFSQELEYGLHDLKEALATSNLSEQGGDNLKRILKDDIEPAINYIVVSVRKMETLVDGILQLSRIGRQPLTLEWIPNLTEIVGEILATKRREIELAGVDVEVGDLPPVAADRLRLTQVLDNLIGNAIKYLDPARPGRISVSGQTVEQKVRLCVEDNGIGIHPGHIGQLFRPFHRLHAKGAGPEGHGLGLSIVERAVKRHNGRVWVESVPGEGSRFWVELPRRNV